MKLNITKNQSGKMFGGVSFELTAKVDLSSDESALVKKYKMEEETLVQKEMSLFGNPFTISIKIGSLVSGETFKCENVAQIIETEENLQSACQSFKNYLDAAASFGGTVSYDF